MFNIYRMLCVALKKSLTGQIQYSSDFHDPIKKTPSSEVSYPPPCNAIWKTLALSCLEENRPLLGSKYEFFTLLAKTAKAG